MMDAVAAQVFGARDQFEIFHAHIQRIAIFESQTMPGRDRAMHILPEHDMETAPRMRSWRIADFEINVTVRIQAQAADRHVGDRHLSLFELRLGAAPARVPALDAFVERH